MDVIVLIKTNNIGFTQAKTMFTENSENQFFVRDRSFSYRGGGGGG